MTAEGFSKTNNNLMQDNLVFGKSCTLMLLFYYTYSLTLSIHKA